MKIQVSFWTLCILIFPCLNFEAQSVSTPELLRIPYYSLTFHDERNFFLYLPEGFHSGDPDQKWPVILFLHGNGERGNGREDLDWVLKEGPLYEAWIQKRNLPFIIISPQLPMYGMDTMEAYIHDRDPKTIPHRLLDGVPDRPTKFATPDSMNAAPSSMDIPCVLLPRGWELEEDNLVEIVNKVIKDYHGDKDRLYLTGLSYGGFGTWYMASRHPEMWAAIAPIVAWGHPDLMKPIAEHHLPVWAFAGGRDTGEPPKYFYPGLNLLESLGDKEVQFT
ncbi:MAG TPA: prolyl oligopeptidase family serine peptidase, partial [Saprospiraceae bacterium]|nr:prolyl oligopeptidase family serine peptidase [Saprospiraceae bacterium]